MFLKLRRWAEICFFDFMENTNTTLQGRWSFCGTIEEFKEYAKQKFMSSVQDEEKTKTD